MNIKEKLLNWADNFPQSKEIHLNEADFNEFKKEIPTAMVKMRMYQFLSRSGKPIRVYFKKDANEL